MVKTQNVHCRLLQYVKSEPEISLIYPFLGSENFDVHAALCTDVGAIQYGCTSVENVVNSRASNLSTSVGSKYCTRQHVCKRQKLTEFYRKRCRHRTSFVKYRRYLTLICDRDGHDLSGPLSLHCNAPRGGSVVQTLCTPNFRSYYCIY